MLLLLCQDNPVWKNRVWPSFWWAALIFSGHTTKQTKHYSQWEAAALHKSISLCSSSFLALTSVGTFCAPAPHTLTYKLHVLGVCACACVLQAAEWGSPAWRLGDPLHEGGRSLLCRPQHPDYHLQWPSHREVLCVRPQSCTGRKPNSNK